MITLDNKRQVWLVSKQHCETKAHVSFMFVIF